MPIEDACIKKYSLIDFEGYAKGWVRKANANSIDGDLQGLESIKRYLFE